MSLFEKIIPFCFVFIFCVNVAQAQCPSENIYLRSQAEVDDFVTLYPNCIETWGDLLIGSTSGLASDVFDLSVLNQITSVAGELIIDHTSDLSDINGLENIQSVGGNLRIEDNAILIDIASLVNLETIGGDLLIFDNDSLNNIDGLMGLTSLNGVLWIEENKSLYDVDGLINLPSIVAGVYIINNDDLDNLDGLGNIMIVEDEVDISSNPNLSDISGLGSINRIEGDLSIGFNAGLIDLSGLEEMEFVGGSVIINNSSNLVSVSGLENLDTIGGSLNFIGNNSLLNLDGLELMSVEGGVLIAANESLSDIDALLSLSLIGGFYVEGNNNLLDLNGLSNIVAINGDLSIGYIGFTNNFVNLEGLSNVKVVGGDLIIAYNQNLVDLSDLVNITSIGGNLDIRQNAQLTNLYGLQNIDNNSITFANISDNPMLSTCSFPNICSQVQSGNVTITNNAADCNSDIELLNNCSTISRVQTNIFYDINRNQIRDTIEINYTDFPVLIEPTDYSYYVQDDGIFYLELGNYFATLDLSSNTDWELTTDSTSYFLSLQENGIDTITFGIYPTEVISHIQTTINAAPARCNERITLTVTTKNLGTTVASGTTWLTIDDAIPDFTFIHQPDTILEAEVTYYGWQFTNLYPGEKIIKKVRVTIPGPPGFNLGEQLLFVSFSEFTDANGEDSSEGLRYNPEVLCSYDPNDKLVNPNREGDYVLFEEDLIYTVRFQNTGNDVAYDVVIRDTLDTNLDLSTFRLLGTSHADRLNTILNEDERILTFEFRDIFLPDSTSNFEASQGYVNYLIETIDGLAEETPVTNSAGIYFDLNPPVITNTTQSIMVSELPTVSVENPDNSFDFNILPNPNAGIFTIQNIPTGTYQIHNTSGQIIRQGDMQNDLLIDISQEAQGVYFISITIDNATSVRRIVKM